MTQINIEATPVELLQVKLVGVDYEMHPPKAALTLRLAGQAKSAGEDPVQLLAVLDEWLKRACGVKVSTEIQARLEDSEDALDYPHIMELMQAVVEATTGNPTS